MEKRLSRNPQKSLGIGVNQDTKQIGYNLIYKPKMEEICEAPRSRGNIKFEVNYPRFFFPPTLLLGINIILRESFNLSCPQVLHF